MRTSVQPAEQPRPETMAGALRSHWPEYLMEGAVLGLFMVSACVFAVLFEHPMSTAHHAAGNPLVRRALMGIAMGATAVSIICSPWGKQSGAHMNPAVTLTFLKAGKIAPWDAFFYIVFQFAGGVAGVTAAHLLLGDPLRHSAVNFVVTAPGQAGAAVAFAAEAAISLLMMSVILIVSNSKRLSRFTAFFAGALVALYITFESPLSGMSMNPARTFGSALVAGQWTALWIYFTAPPVAMLAAGNLYRWGFGSRRVYCAKLHHNNGKRCIFRCNYGELNAR